MIDIDDINYDEVLNGIDISFNEVLENEIKFQNNYTISLERVYIWLGTSNKYFRYINDDIFRQQIKDTYLDHMNKGYDANDISGDYIMKYIDGIDVPMFSSEGFKALCFMQHNDIAMNVCNRFDDIENKYKKALHDSVKKSSAELVKLKKRLATLQEYQGNNSHSEKREFNC